MKINIKSFTAGLLTATLIGSLGFTALAATGTISLEVTPVKIMVNNQEFKPKDAQGREVLVFNHDGTVYAPLRGLADAYGLNVGWDQEKQMATVWDGVAPTAPTKTEATDKNLVINSYEDYKKLWDIEKFVSAGFVTYCGSYRGDLTSRELFAKLQPLGEEKRIEYASKLAKEVMKENSLDYISFLTLTGRMNYEQIEIKNGTITYKHCVNAVPPSVP